MVIGLDTRLLIILGVVVVAVVVIALLLLNPGVSQQGGVGENTPGAGVNQTTTTPPRFTYISEENETNTGTVDRERICSMDVIDPWINIRGYRDANTGDWIVSIQVTIRGRVDEPVNITGIILDDLRTIRNIYPELVEQLQPLYAPEVKTVSSQLPPASYTLTLRIPSYEKDAINYFNIGTEHTIVIKYVYKGVECTTEPYRVKVNP